MIHASSAVRTFYRSVPELMQHIGGSAHIQAAEEKLVINNRSEFLAHLPTIAANAVDFGTRGAPIWVNEISAWMINQGAQQFGVKLNSPDAFYKAIAEGKVEKRFAIPAFNIRGATLDTARAMFAAAKENNVGALIVEISRSEMRYTAQIPQEFSAVIQAAAMLEGWEGPLFLQGDHIQLNAEKVRQGGAIMEGEIVQHKVLIHQLLDAGFGSIDLDMSPFERRDEAVSFDEQQKENYKLTVERILMVRRLEREMRIPYTVMLGGETGEVGKLNTRREDIVAYAEGMKRLLAKAQAELGMPVEGIRKIAVATGTTHGGITLPDGSKAPVDIDFGVLAMARKVALEYGWAGPVQHGASTLPEENFN